MSEMLAAALHYAQQGWPVFPLHGIVRGRCTCGRKDCSSPGKHPLTPHGLKDATTDRAVIEEWWERWPSANIGVATGEPSGIIVIDIDLGHRTNTAFGSPGEEGKGQEPDVWDSIQRVIHKLPRTLTGLSGGGGVHLIYRGTSDLGRSSLRSACDFARQKTEKQPCEVVTLRCTTGRLPGIKGPLPGIDLRAGGGYIVVPPSMHVSGNRYEWLQVSGRPQVDDVYDDDQREERPARPLEGPLGPFVHFETLAADIVDAPAWLREAPRHETPAAPPSPPRYASGDGTAYGLAAIDNALASLRCAVIGQRNHTLNRVAFGLARLVAGGELAESATRLALSCAALEVGLSEWEARQTIDSAFDAGMRQPRCAPHRPNF